MTFTAYAHIELDEQGVPTIIGTTTKVVEVALEHLRRGWGPQEIHEHYPYLSLGQVYSALAYYYDHKLELDRDIEARDREVEKIRGDLVHIQTDLQRKIRERGHRS